MRRMRIVIYLIVGAVLIYETPALCNSLVGWDEAAQRQYDLEIELNQHTVSVNAGLAIEKLRLKLKH